MQEITYPVRIFYSKTGRARYISHLDTMRTLTRALRRSGLPFWYTQGFNPHLYLTFPLPLALGVESYCEIVDLRLTEQMDWGPLKEVVNAHLPPGFEAKSAAAPLLPATAIAWAEYRIEICLERDRQIEVAQAIRELFELPEVPVRKKSKKGEQTIDIRPHMQLLGLDEGESLSCGLRLVAGTSLNVAPRLVLEALALELPPGCVKVLRTSVLDDKSQAFK